MVPLCWDGQSFGLLVKLPSLSDELTPVVTIAVLIRADLFVVFRPWVYVWKLLSLNWKYWNWNVTEVHEIFHCIVYWSRQIRTRTFIVFSSTTNVWITWMRIWTTLQPINYMYKWNSPVIGWPKECANTMNKNACICGLKNVPILWTRMHV